MSKGAICAWLTSMGPTSALWWPCALSSDAQSTTAGFLSSVGRESEEFSAVLGSYETVKYRIGALIIS